MHRPVRWTDCPSPTATEISPCIRLGANSVAPQDKRTAMVLAHLIWAAALTLGAIIALGTQFRARPGSGRPGSIGPGARSACDIPRAWGVPLAREFVDERGSSPCCRSRCTRQILSSAWAKWRNGRNSSAVIARCMTTDVGMSHSGAMISTARNAHPPQGSPASALARQIISHPIAHRCGQHLAVAVGRVLDPIGTKLTVSIHRDSLDHTTDATAAVDGPPGRYSWTHNSAPRSTHCCAPAPWRPTRRVTPCPTTILQAGRQDHRNRRPECPSPHRPPNR